MKSKIKNFCIPLILMIIIDLGYYYLTNAPNFGGEINPHLGILFIAGLFFGPLGCLGAVVGNCLCDIIRGYSINLSITSAITSFILSYFAYKLWYTNSSDTFKVTKPRLNSSRNLIYLLIIIFECGLLYSLITTNLFEIFYRDTIGLNFLIALRYFISFTNFALLFSSIGILICRYKDFTYTPEISEKSEKTGIYKILYILIILLMLKNIHSDAFGSSYEMIIIETFLLTLLLILYIRKPIKEIHNISYLSIPEKIMNYFIILTLLVLIINMAVIVSPLRHIIFELLYTIAYQQEYLILLLLLDVTIVVFFIPALILLTYVEGKVVNPIKSFSKIESFLKKDERIESEKILDIYSDYIDQEDEIGILSRSYTHLINNNNEYIDNLERLEGEKQRTKAELNIAHNIQKATLPSKAIENEQIFLDGFCKPAKEVGGDFYDFYEIDEDNTMIIIGDASGKGVPAALFTIIIQNSVKLLVKHELNPAKVLYEINNQICEKNPEMMFITLFLAIYNNKTHKLTYANAGHNPPIIKNEMGYDFLDIDPEIVLGVMEEYEYKNHEITVEDELILYTDGITDSQNSQQELYGEKRIIKCLNNKRDNDIITALLTDIDEFSKDEKQFDDMTLLTLKVKQ